MCHTSSEFYPQSINEEKNGKIINNDERFFLQQWKWKNGAIKFFPSILEGSLMFTTSLITFSSFYVRQRHIAEASMAKAQVNILCIFTPLSYINHWDGWMDEKKRTEWKKNNKERREIYQESTLIHAFYSQANESASSPTC